MAFASVAAALLLAASGFAIASSFGAFGRVAAGEGTLVFGLVSGVVGGLLILGSIASWLSSRADRSAKELGLFALTDRRVIVWTRHGGANSLAVHSVDLGRIADLSRMDHPDGSGDIVISFTSLTRDASYFASQVRFDSIEDVRMVEALVRRALADADQAQST